jgi:hypothetical protein
MNIVKLKDVIMPDEYTISEFFNKNLKGKYAYWVKMRYIFPLDSLDYETYIKYEQMSDIQLAGHGIHKHIDLYGEDCCMIQFAKKYIDATETEMANDIHQFKTSNMYVADFDIDINDLRTFRTWLANELLLLNTGDNGNYLSLYTPDQIHMLEYYKNNMYDDVVKALSTFGGNNESNITLEQLGQSTCGCSSDLSSLYNLSVNVCDSMTIYRKNIYTHMVEMFSKIDFWSQFPSPFILEFKKYIDNIIKCNFKLTKSQYISEYADCGCINNDEQADLIAILKRLSQSLQYIADNNTIGNKNYINDSLRDWSSRLYELMEW